VYSTPQTFLFATPPAVGTGAAYSLKGSPKFNILTIDKYGQNVTSLDQYSNQNNLSYAIDVLNPDGSFAPSGLNYETGLKGPTYSFAYQDNFNAFNGNPKRQYSLVFKLSEASPATTSSGKYDVYHNAAEVSGVSGVLDGHLISGDVRMRTGTVDINLTVGNSAFYSLSKFEIYTGNASNFAVVTGSGVGGNMLKSIAVFDQKQNYTLTINDNEQLFDGNYYYYKILPYDDFGSGVLYSSPPISGIMYSVVAPTFKVDNLTGKSVVYINSGNYLIESYHNGSIPTTGYNVIDSVYNVSGNIITGGWYNFNSTGDVAQVQTYPFKTIKYLAQITDGTGNVSSREILITDNTTSIIGTANTGIIYSEYAVSDSSQSAQFLVSGSGYVSGSGAICLLAKINYPTGIYKLHRTIL